MMAKILAMFPGQGSQKVGMGKALFDKYETAREMFAQADAALGFPLSDICSAYSDVLTGYLHSAADLTMTRLLRKLMNLNLL